VEEAETAIMNTMVARVGIRVVLPVVLNRVIRPPEVVW
jgi:hypothetical protein